MRRLTRMAGALSIALLAGTGAFAQVPPDPANPNETVADNFTPPPYGDVIDLATAKKVAEAAAGEAAKTEMGCVLHRNRRSERRPRLLREAG
jgi:glc operon protein GlcG